MDKYGQIGILQPQMAYRWRLRVPTLDKDQHKVVAMQAESVKIDYKNKKLIVTLRQNANNTMLHEAIIRMVSQHTLTLHVDSLNGSDDTPTYILEFDCKPVSHDFAFDYTSRDVANHTIEFEYISMTPYNHKEEETEDE